MAIYKLTIIVLVFLLSNAALAGISLRYEIKGFSDRNYPSEEAAKNEALADAIRQARESVAKYSNLEWNETKFVLMNDSIIIYINNNNKEAARYNVNDIGFIKTGEYMNI